MPVALRAPAIDTGELAAACWPHGSPVICSPLAGVACFGCGREDAAQLCASCRVPGEDLGSTRLSEAVKAGEWTDPAGRNNEVKSIEPDRTKTILPDFRRSVLAMQRASCRCRLRQMEACIAIGCFDPVSASLGQCCEWERHWTSRTTVILPIGMMERI